MITVGAVRAFLQDRYPESSAQDWDRVGSVTGEADDPVSGILLTVDVTDAVIEQAAAIGANLIIAHHPLLLRGIHTLDPGRPKGRMITRLIRDRIALITAHTNADVPSDGVCDALATTLGLTGTRPLEPVPIRPLEKVVCYVPADRTEALIDALSAAGAGGFGRYDRCAFSTPGMGTFRPLPGSDPVIGTIGRSAEVPEDRVEMIMERRHRSAVIRALLAVHPYSEPAYEIVPITEPADAAAGAGLGRIGTVEPTTLAGFADRVAATLPPTASGVRVSGDPDRPIRTVAVQGGAGDDLLDAARQAGADVYLTSDLRHHPASEAIAWAGAPALIDVAHWAAEWTWLPRLRAQLRDGLSATGLLITVSELRTDPWDFVVGTVASDRRE